MKTWIDLHALWRIVVVGLLAGAALPALFAVGLRALGTGANATTISDVGDDRIVGGSVPGLIAATVCFAAVLAGVGLGIYTVVATS